MRRRLIALALAASSVPVAAVVVDPGLPGGDLASGFQLSTAESYVGGLVNGSRIYIGRRVSYTEATAAQCARDHSVYMAGRGQLSHQSQQQLATCLPAAVEIAETVGAGPSLNTIHQAMLNSTQHRAILLDPDWVYLGPGVYRDSYATYWVTEIYWR